MTKSSRIVFFIFARNDPCSIGISSHLTAHQAAWCTSWIAACGRAEKAAVILFYSTLRTPTRTITNKDKERGKKETHCDQSGKIIVQISIEQHIWKKRWKKKEVFSYMVALRYSATVLQNSRKSRVLVWTSYRTHTSSGYGYRSLTELTEAPPGIVARAYITHRSSGQV